MRTSTTSWIFVNVAQFESLSRAARSLGMPISTGAGGYRCWNRTSACRSEAHTRRVTLTAQGREYFNQCREPLTLLEKLRRC